MEPVNIDEDWYRRDRGFRIIGNDEVGYHVRACGNHRCLSNRFELKSLQEARDWLVYYYPGTKPYSMKFIRQDLKEHFGVEE